MAPDGGAKLAQSFDEAHDPALPVFSALAKELNVWLLIGSLAIKVSDTKTANRSFLFAPDGSITARYSKIHLFDAALTSGEVYRESNTVAGGAEAVVADTALGLIGLTICYDVRFPQLYRRLAQKGAFLITAPAAFTVPTGEAHWHVLLRARKWRIRDGSRARWASRQWPQDLWPQPDHLSLGRDFGRGRLRSRRDHRRD